MLLDNTGDDPDRHAAVFINVRHGKRNIVLLAGCAPVEAGVGNGVSSVIQADIHHALMHICHLAGIFALHPTLLQIGAVGVLGYAFYICTDGKLLQAITVDLQNTDEDLIPDGKAVIGIPDPIPGQVPCHD